MRTVAEKEKNNLERSMEFLFLHAPKEILGSARVEGIVFGINEVQGDKIVDTDNNCISHPDMDETRHRNHNGFPQLASYFHENFL